MLHLEQALCFSPSSRLCRLAFLLHFDLCFLTKQKQKLFKQMMMAALSCSSMDRLAVVEFFNGMKKDHRLQVHRNSVSNVQQKRIFTIPNTSILYSGVCTQYLTCTKYHTLECTAHSSMVPKRMSLKFRAETTVQ